MKQQLTMVTKRFNNVKAKHLKKRDHVFVGSREVTVIERKKNGFGQIIITFRYWNNGQDYGTTVVDKNFLFNVRRVERPEK